MISLFTRCLIAIPCIYSLLSLFLKNEINPLALLSLSLIPCVFAFLECRYRDVEQRADSELDVLNKQVELERLNAQLDDIKYHRSLQNSRRDEQSSKIPNDNRVFF